MKKVLILCDDYYPSSRATIAITQRFAEGLAEKGYEVNVMTIRERIKSKPDYPKEKNGVKVFDYSEFEDMIKEGEQKKLIRIEKRSIKLLRIIQREKHLVIKKDGTNEGKKNRWNSIVDKVRTKQREHYNCMKHNQLVLHRSIIASNYVRHFGSQIVVSVSLPFSIEEIGCKLKRSIPDIKWVPIAFDPFAFDETVGKQINRIRNKKEQKTYHHADKVMFLSQFKNDYANSSFKDKIVFFDLPNIRYLEYRKGYPCVAYDSRKINCAFIGNLFFKQRHPDYLFNIISKLPDETTFYIIGGLIDIAQEYIDEWVNKLKGKLVYYGRVSQEEAINSMLKADVLVNMGNITSNQCPSKLIDYISTGKPIINLRKIEKCTSSQCLENYKIKYEIKEGNPINDKTIESLLAFLRKAKTASVIPYSEIQETYNDYTIDSMINKFQLLFV